MAEFHNSLVILEGENLSYSQIIMVYINNIHLCIVVSFGCQLPAAKKVPKIKKTYM